MVSFLMDSEEVSVEYNSIFVLFIMIPAAVLLTAVLPGRTKRWFLILAGIFFYA